MAHVTSLVDLTDLKGKNVVVVGAGKTGASSARVALHLGATVTIVDDADDAKVRAGLEKAGLAANAVAAGAKVVSGGIPADVVAGADLVVLSPGVPRAHAAIAPAIANGVPFINEVELAAAVLAARGHVVKTIGITGTNGKSTTTTMCGAIAKAFDANAFVGGNLGTAYCSCAIDVLENKATAPQVAVLELSSYQLETIGFSIAGAIRFDAAVVTNLTPDHLDRYPSAAAYYAAKARIFSMLSAGGGASVNANDPESRTHLAAALEGVRARCDFDVSKGMEGITIDDDRAVPKLIVTEGLDVVDVRLDNPNIVGHHNRQNAAAAVACCFLAGIPVEVWQAGIDAYAGIAHRLERVGEHNGVAWFNDSKGTNVDATMTAVRSFARGVHLIAGGLGKNSPYEPLVEVSKGRVVAVYTIGKDAPLIDAAFKAGGIPVVDSGTLDVAVQNAKQAAQPGDVILMSPACASFDQFKDYAHRGETFRALFTAASTTSTKGTT